MGRVIQGKRWGEYVVPVIAVAVAGLLRLILQPALGHEYEFTTLFLAVVVSAWAGGFGPAALALTLSCVVAGAIHGFTHRAIFPDTSEDSVGLFLYIIMGLAVGVLGETQRRARQSLLIESEGRKQTIKQLSEEMDRRQQAESQLRESREQLIELNTGLEERVNERTNELTLALQELEEFTYAIAHDMRAPLRSVNASCRLIADECGDQIDAAGQELIGTAMQAANFMNRFVDDLLDYARLSRATIRKSKLDLSGVVDLLGAELRKTDPTVEISVQRGMQVVSDPYLTNTLIQELLDNAHKFRKPQNGCRIRVEELEEPFADIVTVTDNGIGFEMDYALKVFEPFQRLHRGTTYPGTGIGLAKAKRIVERLGGSIWADAVPGKGCTIVMRFPHRLQYEGRTALVAKAAA